MRSEVAESWRRSAAAGVTVDVAEPPITLATDDLLDYRAAHPLARVFPLLEDVLGGAARDCDALLALSDAGGQLLWVSGSAATLRRAESIGFVEGANWDERIAGTNAPGTSLVLGKPTVVTGAEHFREVVRPWNCVAAPIHDPDDGRVLGVLDITGGLPVAVPQTLAMVRAAAQLAERELARVNSAQGSRPPEGDSRRRAFTLECLGRREGLLCAGRRTMTLGLRHSEILTVLATAPRGLSGEELAELVYPHPVTPSTLRAEMNRLRATVGAEVLASRPYRLTVAVAADWHAVRASLAAGDVLTAMRRYVGPLLPHSEAPAVRAMREDLQAELRAAVLGTAEVDVLAAWTRTSWGADDYAAWSAQRDLLPGVSPLASLVKAQVARLDRELGMPGHAAGT